MKSKNQICANCGHKKGFHGKWKRDYGFRYCSICSSCKKFKVQKGCGKDISYEYNGKIVKRTCGVQIFEQASNSLQLCPECQKGVGK